MLSPELQKTYDNLTDKQKRFVDLWSGVAEETARLAGYKKPETEGRRLLKDVRICTLIKAIKDSELKPLIANRSERQKFWSDTMRDKETPLKERLKASELLGKSEADFIDVKATTDKTIEELLQELDNR